MFPISECYVSNQWALCFSSVGAVSHHHQWELCFPSVGAVSHQWVLCLPSGCAMFPHQCLLCFSSVGAKFPIRVCYVSHQGVLCFSSVSAICFQSVKPVIVMCLHRSFTEMVIPMIVMCLHRSYTEMVRAIASNLHWFCPWHCSLMNYRMYLQ